MSTIKDVAQKAGVSVTTVSRVINNKPDVSEDTKKKVLNIIEELGYKPSGVARGLVLKKSFTMGLIIPDISNPFFPEIVRGVEQVSKEKGYSVILYTTENDKQDEKNAIEVLKSKRVDGLIVSLSIRNKHKLLALEEKNFPVVQIDRKIPGSAFPTVTIDNIKSSYNATKYLIKQGHTRIAHLTGDLETETGKERLEGFNRAMTDYNLPVRDQWILNGDYSRDSGYQLTKEILKLSQRPSALFAANDFMAVGCYSALAESGLEVPGDLSIIGHDDIYIASLMRPALTTMTQPKYELGTKAGRILIDHIENRSKGKTEDIILETELSIRNSVKGLDGDE